MNKYFNLTAEERQALADKRDFRPANFSKTQPEAMVEQTEELPVEEPIIEEVPTEEESPVKKSKKSKK
jgi:hypothetical protein